MASSKNNSKLKKIQQTPTPHNAAKKGQIAPIVLMPGDPERAEWIAKTFLTGAKLVTDIRGVKGFTGKFNGKPVSVMSMIAENQYTLVDFWASWCGPCRAEMPNVVAAYDKYHEKGFEVVGVSLDEDKKAWLAAIEKLQMPWPQLSDLKGWNCEGAVLYKIQSIPSNLLVDQQGKIVATNLREEALQDKLAELFN